MTASLEVDRDELKQALKRISRLTKSSQKAKAIISFADDTMMISMPGINEGISARGSWPGQARIPVTFLLMLTTHPLVTSPITITVVGNRMQILNCNTGCDWEEDSVRISLPLNPTFAMVLSLMYHYTSEDIEKAGLSDTVADAKKRSGMLLGKAFRLLGEFGITEDELNALVDDKLRSIPKPE